MICAAARAHSVVAVKKALVVIATLALVASFLLGAANAVRASQRDQARPATRAATATETIRVQYQEVQVNTFEIDTHDGGTWGEPSGSNGG